MWYFSQTHLFSGPELFRFQDSGRERSDVSVVISESGEDELLVVVAIEETTSHGQGHTADHVILNETRER